MRAGDRDDVRSRRRLVTPDRPVPFRRRTHTRTHTHTQPPPASGRKQTQSSPSGRPTAPRDLNVIDSPRPSGRLRVCLHRSRQRRWTSGPTWQDSGPLRSLVVGSFALRVLPWKSHVEKYRRGKSGGLFRACLSLASYVLVEKGYIFLVASAETSHRREIIAVASCHILSLVCWICWQCIDVQLLEKAICW